MILANFNLLEFSAAIVEKSLYLQNKDQHLHIPFQCWKIDSWTKILTKPLLKLQPWSQGLRNAGVISNELLENVIAYAFCPFPPLCNVDETGQPNILSKLLMYLHWNNEKIEKKEKKSQFNDHVLSFILKNIGARATNFKIT